MENLSFLKGFAFGYIPVSAFLGFVVCNFDRSINQKDIEVGMINCEINEGVSSYSFDMSAVTVTCSNGAIFKYTMEKE